MKISCGVDIIEIDRIKRSFDQCGEAFKNRVYTNSEIEYCEARKASKFQSYAARFAAKEAVTKAFGTGISDGVSFLDIEVLNNDQGMPYVVLSGRAKEIFVSNCWNSISLSLSHCDSHAVAYTVLS